MSAGLPPSAPVPPVPHLVIPFAACHGDAWAQAMKSLPPTALQNLGKLLAGMRPLAGYDGQALSLSPPHERVLAEEQGLARPDTPDGLIPWAAAQARAEGGGQAWAWVTPCHWSMGREHATLGDPLALGLSEQTSRALMAAMQPYFETEGITLHYASPAQWLAEGEIFRDLPSASLDRALGRNVDPWLPGAAGGSQPPKGSALAKVTHPGARTLRRLQNEMQMLLYTHALNDERTGQRQQPVNSFWLSGTGTLPQGFVAPAAPQLPTPRSLAQAAFSDDWNAYLEAWTALDATELAALLERQRSGEAVRLSLCGESNARTWQSAPRNLASRISGLFRPQRPLDLLGQL
jgi:hypothetical protein